MAIIVILLMTAEARAAGTEWKWTIYIVCPRDGVTAVLKNQFALIYVNGGSGETYESEYKCMDNVSKFSLTGATPATHYGIATPAKGVMREDFEAFLDALSGASYVGVAATKLTNWDEGEVVRSTMQGVSVGQFMTWDQLVAYMQTTWGLKQIPPVTGP